jgi:signal transduction histidine kinase
MRSVGEVALQQPLEAPAYREVIGSMLEEVARLTGLVESLLMLTRVDSGHAQVSREAVDLAVLAGSAVEHLRVLAEEKTQTLVIETAAPVEALCDPGLVRQAVVNLLDNAIKYTPHGGEVRVTARRLPSGEAVVEVKDSGPGIAASERERVFERFYRVDKGRARSTGGLGLGLGLAIARAALAATDGRIELESEEGRGSTFRVVLPGVAP